MTGSLRGRARSSRPRRQVKNAARSGFRHVENVFGRQRSHRSLQPAAIERVIGIHSIMQNKPNFPRFCAKNSLLEEKQTQFKPNRTQFQPTCAENKPNQTQFQTRHLLINPMETKLLIFTIKNSLTALRNSVECLFLPDLEVFYEEFYRE